MSQLLHFQRSIIYILLIVIQTRVLVFLAVIPDLTAGRSCYLSVITRQCVTEPVSKCANRAEVIPPNQRALHEDAKLVPSSERAKKITKCISYFTAKDMRPYSVVENTGFHYMVHSLEPRHVISSQSFVTLKSIPNLYKETKLSMQESLNSAHRVAIICDAWTSRAAVSYVTVAAHYVSS